MELRQSSIFTTFLDTQLPEIIAKVNEDTAHVLFEREKAEFLGLIQENMTLLDAMLKGFAASR